MAIGMSRREQWALIGVVVLIALGVGFHAWRRSSTDGPVVYVPGQGRWEKVADFEAGKRPAPPLATSASATSSSKSAGGASTTSATTGGGIDLNLATLEELDRLPGIGASRAAAILELRTRLGGFSSVEQLDQVSGIGAKTLARLRPYVRVAARQTSASAPFAPPPPAAPGPASGAPPALAATPAPMLELAAPTVEVKTPSRPKAGAAEAGTVDINLADAGQLQQIKGIGPALAGRIIEDRKLHGPYRTAGELTRVKGIGPLSLQKMLPQIRVASPHP